MVWVIADDEGHVLLDGEDDAESLRQIVGYRTRNEAKVRTRMLIPDGTKWHVLKMVERLPDDLILTRQERKELEDLVWKLKQGRVRALELVRKKQ